MLHLPIAPAPRHPNNGILLELDGDLKLPKETYVKIHLPYMIPWSMLKTSCRDLRSGKILELKPRSFATLLQYVESRLASQPKLQRKGMASRRITYRGSPRARRSNPPRLVRKLLWNIVTVVLIMVLIYVILAYLRALLGRTTDWVREIMAHYLGSWSPLQLVDGV